MTNDPLYHQLRELSWHRKLTPAEETRLKQLLAANPELQADWEIEAGLNSALGRLPEPSVATNFTARVMQEIERETAREGRASKGSRFWRWQVRWLPRFAGGLVVVGAVALTYNLQDKANRRVELARNVATVSDAISDTSATATPDVLENFDAIYALKPLPTADEELLSLLQ
jgi:anti-sigma factor RsiW